jgi:ATP-dependent Clp protease ATP-binding subunit ClpC
MMVVIREIEDNSDIIVFIDEIHTLVGSGGDGASDGANILKPALARGNFKCIGSTTLDEYRENIETDKALVRRFCNVMVAEPTEAETLTILQNIKDKYEEHHIVEYSDEAIKLCVKLSGRYINERFFPDKAIDVMDEAGAKVRVERMKVPYSTDKNIVKMESDLKKILDKKSELLKIGGESCYEEAAKFREREKLLIDDIKIKKHEHDIKHITQQTKTLITANMISEIVSIMTGIPVRNIDKDESVRLLNLENTLGEDVLGQDEALNLISRCVRRNRIGLKTNKKPIGSFIFLGPTGVGKTHLAKMLAKNLFGDENNMERIDMSEYTESFNVSRLIGSPPGYVGYEEGGQLTEKIRKKPYTVVLLDEIEKAHPRVFNLFLQVLDEGFLTDGLGNKVNFRNTIIIMTSNVGIRELSDFGVGVGFNTPSLSAKEENLKKDVLTKALKKKFAPEFLNRLDGVITFNSLSKENIKGILEKELEYLYTGLGELGFKLNISKEVKEFILEDGWNEEYGARPLKRSIQNNIEDLISEEVIRGKMKKGCTIKIVMVKDKIAIKF